MDQWERNRQAIDKVGSSHLPPPEETPLGTVIEMDPEWVCVCCDQEIPRPSNGFSTPVGSFCGPCFVGYIDFLFNQTPPAFLNQIRRWSQSFIGDRREEIENGVVKPPELEPMKTMGALRRKLHREIARLAGPLSDYSQDDRNPLWGVVEGLKRAIVMSGVDYDPEDSHE